MKFKITDKYGSAVLASSALCAPSVKRIQPDQVKCEWCGVIGSDSEIHPGTCGMCGARREEHMSPRGLLMLQGVSAEEFEAAMTQKRLRGI